MASALRREGGRWAEARARPVSPPHPGPRVPVKGLLIAVRAADVASVAATGAAAWCWLGGSGARGSAGLPATSLALAALLMLNLARSAGLYTLPRLRRAGPQAAAIGCCASVSILAAALLGRGATPVPAGFLAAWLAAAAALLAASRLALPALVERLDRRGLMARRIAVVGTGEQGQRLVRRLRASPGTARLVGLFDDRDATPGPARTVVAGCPVAGDIDALLAFAERHPIDVVVVALPLSAEARVLECLRRLRRLAADVRLCPDLMGLHLGRQGVTDLAGVPLLNVYERPLRAWARIAKAVEDRLIASVALAVAAPLMVALGLAVRLTSPGPALFRQRRHGLNGRVIEVLKFRTMRVEPAPDGRFRQARRDDPRVTPLGRFLRRTSLDELPQLINVLRGEMSIVGPRPHAVAHGDEFAPLIDAYLARHRVKPGITGWAQVHGLRGETDTLEKMERRLEHDLHYIEHWSLLLDLRIVLRTLAVGFRHPNAY